MDSINAVKLLVDEQAHNYAKIYAALLKDEFQRKRAYASIVALYALVEVLEKTSFDIQKSMTLFRNPILNEKYEIADFYLNNWHLDVRVVTGNDVVFLPKVHYSSNIAPDFYMVVRVDSSLKNAELVGVVDSKNSQKTDFDNNYFAVSLDSLMSYEEFLKKVQEEKEVLFSAEEHEFFLENYLALMDNELDERTANKVLSHLFLCPECRNEFCCFTGFEMVSCNCGQYPDVLEDGTLGIVAAQNVDEEKYQGFEETIVFDKHEKPKDEIELIEDSAPDIKEETVSDILEELFNVDEGFQDNSNIVEEKTFDEVLPESIENENDDMQLIEEELDSTISANNEIEILDEVDEENSELLIVEEDKELSSSDDIQIVDFKANEELKQDKDDIVLEQDNQEEIQLIYDEIVEEETIDNVVEEKVIVDYDEFGEPIYSYISNIENTSKGEDIEPIDENSQEEKISDELNNEQLLPTDDKSEIVDENIDADSSNLLPDDNLESILQDDEGKTNSQEDSAFSEFYYDKDEEKTEDDSELENITTKEEQVDSTYNDEEQEETEDEYSDEEYEDEEDDYDVDDILPEEQIADGDSKGPMVLVSIIVLLGLIGGGTFFFLKNKSNSEEIVLDIQNENNAIEIAQPDQVNDMFEENVDADTLTIPVSEDAANLGEIQSGSIEELTAGDLIVPKQAVQNYADVNNSIASAFQNRTGVSFKGLNWFCTSQLFSDIAFKNYLQNLDNVLKQNLKNNILNSTETPQDDSVEAKFAVDNNGNLKKVIISKSSGSQQIDNIVLQSINESFVGEKSPILNDSSFKSDMYFLKVVIKL